MKACWGIHEVVEPLKLTGSKTAFVATFGSNCDYCYLTLFIFTPAYWFKSYILKGRKRRRKICFRIGITETVFVSVPFT